jgi:hypothetical protein
MKNENLNMLGSGNQVRVRLAGDQGRDWQDDEGNKCRRWSHHFSAIVRSSFLT